MLNASTDVLVVYLAASQAIDGQMSVGMITAFMAYKGQFLGRMTALLDQLITFWLLDVQLARVADIALADREPNLISQSNHAYDLQGHITLRDISFRYAPREKDIIRNLSLDITPGECVVIFGESGGGKSTLLKLITGLLLPSAGEIQFDGLDIAALGLHVLRPQLGVLMQEDQLIAGSIADNIALFDDRIDMDRVRVAAAQAQIGADIMRFPMQFNSLVGDMGSALSSGQKQRILLARALYRRPRVLILDEGTAHIDPEREAVIRTTLRGLPITRIIVAHNPAMADIADRVFQMENGQMQMHQPVSKQPTLPIAD